MAQQTYGIDVDTLDKLHEDLDMPRADILHGLGLSPRDLDLLQLGQAKAISDVLRRLHALVDLRDGLYETFASSDGVREWMRAELRYLQWRTPQQVIGSGDPERAYAAFEALASGIFI